MNDTQQAVADLGSMAGGLCGILNEKSGLGELNGVRPHILLALAYMQAVREYHELLREKNPDAVAAAKDAANRVSSFPEDKSADWIVSQQPLDRVEIVKIDGISYVAVSSLMGNSRPLWTLFHDELTQQWRELERKLERYFGKLPS